ncbi:extracellular solute-binding protein [Pseudomonas sp. DTU_2021_1001937_2_SI_NGA_ILE_001]|uniref:extracellular solute-binding protein n=1 Tax=Pseudomonas sp. DTU_2021_1001937_2_SI_NGA_ILE_001 TaxID=3077589 RepID=UPI0028FC13B9|nr:extracellular solute-binding protein [Pseudomonas sp. DTU_2021_1001937_2_SI_NGA_ILE_001]WNW10177.1 extracellular solute-binding protein [Pseudomonas sp. DTU_2021_1001937_2_SI_NGA_ILE_001]
MLKKAMLGLVLLATAAQGAETVNIANWTDYIAPDTLANFKAATGIQSHYTTYESNRELNVKLLARHSGYDVVVPSIHFMAQQIAVGALKPLDKSRLPNWNNLNPVLLKALQVSDPGNAHGFPYLWGSTGIAYNRDKVKALLGDKAPVDSWDLIFKPENISKLAKCGVAVVRNAPEMLPIALNYLDLPPHSTSVADYAKAEALLASIKPYITSFQLDGFTQDLIQGKTCVAVGLSGDIAMAQQAAQGSDVHIDYVVPKEGAPMWFDMVAMPVDAPNEKAAYAFMNYLLRPDVIANISNRMRYANGNEKADALIIPSVWNDKTVYPSDDTISRMFVLENVTPEIAALRDQIWNRIKTGE